MTATDLDHWMEDAGAKVRRRIRLLMLLDAADYAGNSPLSVSRLHAFAFLADVLSPLYNLTALSGRIMKRRIGPYFPDLQWELDRLIGQGLVDVSDLQPIVEVIEAERLLSSIGGRTGGGTRGGLRCSRTSGCDLGQWPLRCNH